jgi:glycosyltransferase involved in cell wall biosynthesis
MLPHARINKCLSSGNVTSTQIERPLRVLQVVHGFPPHDVAGVEVYTENLARELATRHHVGVFYRRKDMSRAPYSLTRSARGEVSTYEVVRNVEEDDIVRDPSLFPLSYWDPDTEEPFQETLSDFSPDLVHFHHVIRLSASLIPLTRRAGIPIVLTVHDHWFMCPRIHLLKTTGAICRGSAGGARCVECMVSYRDSSLLKVLAPVAELCLLPLGASMSGWPRSLNPVGRPLLALLARDQILHQVFRAVSVAISPSYHVRNMLLRNGFPTGKVRVIPNGIDHRPFQKPGHCQAGILRLGYLGGLTWKKGLHVALESLTLLGDLPVELIVFANITSNSDHDQQLRELARKVRARFAGAFEHNRIAEVLASLDAVVVPSLCYENDPLVVQEAYLAGLPVVASRVGALREKVVHERTGLTFTPGDPKDLARQIRRLVSEPGLLDRLRSKLPVPPTVEENAAAVEQVYWDAIRSRRPPEGRSRSRLQTRDCPEVET